MTETQILNQMPEEGAPSHDEGTTPAAPAPEPTMPPSEAPAAPAPEAPAEEPTTPPDGGSDEGMGGGDDAGTPGL